MKNLLNIAALVAALCTATLTQACVSDTDETSEASLEAVVSPKFDLWQNDAGQYYFHLAAANGEILLASQGYQSRTGAINGVLSVLDNGGLDVRYAIKQGSDRKHYVSLLAANQQVIATGEGYSTKSNANRAVKTMVRNVAAYLQHWDNPTGARFQVKASSSSAFSFALYAGNGEVVLTSESYTTEAAALNGAFAVQENGVDAANYKLLQANDGRSYFVLRAKNNEVIGVSQMYTTKESAQRAINSVTALLVSGAAELL
ncbi:MAG: YegP family protein [Kofleriaceae bacterium]|nr:YegP family protein [Kofleriaceae bacterium]